MAEKVPIFICTCIKSDYPQHLMIGCRYKIDVTKKNRDNEISVFWFEPVELKWVFIGYFALGCFDNALIKKWLNEKKGTKEIVRERPVVRERQIVRERI